MNKKEIIKDMVKRNDGSYAKLLDNLGMQSIEELVNKMKSLDDFTKGE